MLYRLYPVALDCGIKPDEFWDSTITEINDRINSFERTYSREAKEKISLTFLLSKLVIEQYASASDKKIKPPKPWDYYPELFKEEKITFRAAEKAEELEDYKVKRKAFAQKHNAKIKSN